MTIAALVKNYLAHLYRMQRKSISQTSSHANRLVSNQIQVQQFDPLDYAKQRHDAGAKNATINREMEILKCAATYWKRLFNEDPGLRYFTSLPENNVRQGFFTPQEFDRLIAALPPHLALFTRFAYITGWRKGEIANLQWEDLDDPGLIRIHDSKNGEGRVIPIAGPLKDLIHDTMWGREDCPWVFHDPEHNKIRDFRKAWTTACKKAGLEGRLFHDLRRTAIRNMIEAQIDREIAKKITGHKTDSMFTRYQIVDKRQMQTALEKL